jgi:hypothetical protein
VARRSKEDRARDLRSLARVRLARLARLRQCRAPLWIIRWEQVALLLNRKGIKADLLSRTPSKLQRKLVTQYVKPLMADTEGTDE